MKIIVAALVLVILSACSPKQVVETPTSLRPVEGPRTKQIEPEARSLYFQAERAFSAKNYDQALRLFSQVKTKYPRGKAQAYATYRMAVIHYFREDYTTASREFESFLTKLPNSELSFDATYNWAAAEYQRNQFDRAYQVLSRLKLADIQSQGPRRAETVYALTARVAAALGNHAGVVAAHALQLQLPIEDGVRNSLETRIVDQLNQISTRATLEQLLREVNEPTTRTKITARLESLIAAEAPQVAIVPTPETIIENERRIELPSGGSSGSRTNVGVVLPLTGKFASYGKRALEGILLASKVFDPSSESSIKLFIEDSESNPLAAQHAVDELVEKHNVMAIIGPLSWKESVAVAERAGQLGIPNLSLSAKEGISEKSPYLFQNALTPRVQIESLVQFCIQNRKFRRFAVLAPNNAFGKDMTKQFWDMVELYGGKVVAHETYDPEEKDFQAHIKDLIGLSDPKFRKLEQAKLFEYLREQKAKTGKEPKVQLPPIIDFDALFIPDSPKAVAQIAPSLAYFEVNGISLLGTTEWNSDAFFRRGGKYVEGAIFPAGLHLGTRNPKTREFIQYYQQAYGTPPDLLAVQAYEAMDIVIAGIQNGRSEDRNILVNQLSRLKDFETPIGNLTFDNDRIARRKLSILMLENGGQVSEY